MTVGSAGQHRVKSVGYDIANRRPMLAPAPSSGHAASLLAVQINTRLQSRCLQGRGALQGWRHDPDDDRPALSWWQSLDGCMRMWEVRCLIRALRAVRATAGTYPRSDNSRTNGG